MPVYDVNGYIISGGGNDDVIQPYFQTEFDATVASTRAAQTEPCLTFALVTDIHYNSVDKIVFPHTLQNIKAFSKQVRLDGILCLGDMTDGDQTKSVTAGLLNEIMPAQRDIGVPVYFAAGNHDCNAYGAAANVYTTAQMYQYYYSHCANDVMLDTGSYGVNFYKDFPEYKIRMISLDSAKSDDGSAYHYNYPMNTVNWFVNTAMATIPSGYTVLLISHVSPILEHNWTGSSGAGTVPKNNADVIAALTTFVNGGGKVICLYGHSHADFDFSSPWLDVASYCNKLYRYEDIVITSETAAAWHLPVGSKIWAREMGTYKEDTWDVVVIKPYSHTLNMIRFGAGEDRSYSY